jgi:hypothetical protein
LLLLLKVILAPILIAIVTLGARRWGPGIGLEPLGLTLGLALALVRSSPRKRPRCGR